MAVYHNKGAHGTSDVEVTNGSVTAFKKGTKNKFEWINFGIYALRKEALSLVPAGRPCDEQEFFEQLIRKEQLLAYEATERFYEIGSIEALREFESFISKEEKRQR
jgi:NDP-sugar pyrophosphorylase family protein